MRSVVVLRASVRAKVRDRVRPKSSDVIYLKVMIDYSNQMSELVSTQIYVYINLQRLRVTKNAM